MPDLSNLEIVGDVLADAQHVVNALVPMVDAAHRPTPVLLAEVEQEQLVAEVFPVEEPAREEIAAPATAPGVAAVGSDATSAAANVAGPSMGGVYRPPHFYRKPFYRNRFVDESRATNLVCFNCGRFGHHKR